MTEPTSTEVARRETGTDLVSAAEERRLTALMRQCTTLAKSDLVPKALKDKPDNIFALALYGEQFGLSPIHAIQRIYIIQGTFEPKAEVLAGVIMRAGHELRWDEVSPERCTVSIRRAGTDYWQATTWTIEQARKAGLLDVWVEKWSKTSDGKNYKEECVVGDDHGIFSDEERTRRALGPLPAWAQTKLEAGEVVRKDPWHKFPDDMLAAKALRRGGKRVAPDALLGIDDDVDRFVPMTPETMRDERRERESEPEPEDVIVGDEIPDDAPPPADDRAPARPGPQAIAIEISRKGITDRDARLRVVEVLVGLEAGSLESTKNLTADQVGAVLRALASLSEADLEEIVHDAIPEADVVVEEGGPDNPGSATAARETPPAPKTDDTATDTDAWTETAWRTFLSERGVKVTETIKEAQRLAREDGEQGPGTLEGIVNSSPAMKGLLVGFVEDLAAQRSGS